MPEFNLPGNDTTAFNSLNDFTQGYIEAAFFTDTGTSDDAENDLEFASFDQLDSETIKTMVADCARFRAVLPNAARSEISERQSEAGRDFWYTRNRHGVGYWDGDYPEIAAKQLEQESKRFREIRLVRGDNGEIYAE
jgi:hypothetical protein